MPCQLKMSLMLYKKNNDNLYIFNIKNYYKNNFFIKIILNKNIIKTIFNNYWFLIIKNI